MILRWLVVALSLTLIAPASAVGAPPARAADDSAPRLPAFGAVYHGMWDLSWEQRAQILDRLESFGVQWVRIGVPWSAIQPRRPTAEDPGWGMRWGVPKADRVIAMAYERGFKISVTIHRTPDWANGGRGPAYLPFDLDHYAQAAQWMAHRYGDQVRSWEIWNEPNNPKHLLGGPAPRYTEMLCKAYAAIHNGDATTTVVFGGTSGNAWRYIDETYEAGSKGCFDVMATHPYNQDKPPDFEPPDDSKTWFQNIRLVRDVMLRHGDGATPVWFTESGWSSHDNTESTPGYQRGVTLEQQAQYAEDMLRITANDFPYVRQVFWYESKDEQTGNLENDNFGLFTVDLQPKPVAFRVRNLLTGSG
jgi:polysaccharide biosynthesis protein PslG